MKIVASLAILLSLYFLADAQNINYAWFTNFESPQTFPGDILRFFGRDTLWGPVHSNDWISTQNVGGLPVFYGQVSTTKPRFRPGSPNPAGIFLGGPPIFSTPYIQLPWPDDELRDLAQQSNTYFSLPGEEWYATIHRDTLLCYHWPEGTFLDTLTVIPTQVPLDTATYVFFDNKVEVRGEINPIGYSLVIGSSRNIRIVDNVILEGTDIATGLLPAGATSRMCLASDEWIIIGNTLENGRDNCGGDFSNPARCDVVITALIYALGSSLQIEQMNDVFDWYIGPTPDERGRLIINGGLTQRWRGYVHRSNHSGTGYSFKLRYDERLRFWQPGFETPYALPTQPDVPDSLIFDDTPVGTTRFDTLRIDSGQAYSGAWTSSPFASETFYQFQSPFRVPVSFTPQAAGPWYGLLTFYVYGDLYSVHLRGNGISSASPLTTEVFPNPFNNISTLRLTLPQASHVRAVVYDILGREVTKLADNTFPAGPHTLSVDGSSWASGLYFLRTESLGQVQTRKLMLLK